MEVFYLGNIFLHLRSLNLITGKRSVVSIRSHHEMFISFVQNYAAVFVLQDEQQEWGKLPNALYLKNNPAFAVPVNYCYYMPCGNQRWYLSGVL